MRQVDEAQVDEGLKPLVNLRLVNLPHAPHTAERLPFKWYFTFMNIAVIGLGGAGSAALRHLALSGAHRVTGFEQGTVGNDQMSSWGASRIIRRLYDDPLYAFLIGDAYRLWNELEADAREPLFTRTGGVFVGRDDSAALARTRSALQTAGLLFETWTGRETRARFPGLYLDDDESAVWDKEAGFLHATACVVAQCRLAVQAGAVIRENAPVKRLDSDTNGSGGVRVTLRSGEKATFDRVVVTAGPWLPKLLPNMAQTARLTVTRQTIAYLAERDPAAGLYVADRFPIWADLDHPALVYGTPLDGAPLGGVKLAAHQAGPVVDVAKASAFSLPPSRDLATLTEYAARRLPGADPARIVYAQSCRYVNTPDEDFALGWSPDLPDVFAVSACSGHGFKFTILTGKWAADAVAGGATPPGGGRFAWDRFDMEVK